MSRVLMSYFASVYVRMITRINIQDATAGFKCYRRVVLATIPFDKNKFIGYAFQIEMKFASWRLGFKIAEVPIVFRDRKHGASKMSKGIIKEGITGVFAMQWQYIFGDYLKRIRK
jgi:dolichol-phosphate mannosyltransferase